MEIITALVGVSFALFLAALAVTPNLIAVYLELRAQKRHGVQQNASGLLAAYPPPVPFNYPQIFLRKMPRETDRLGITERHGAQQNASELLGAIRLPYLSITHKYFGGVRAVLQSTGQQKGTETNWRFGIQSPGFEPRHGHVRRGNDLFKASGVEQATRLIDVCLKAGLKSVCAA